MLPRIILSLCLLGALLHAQPKENSDGEALGLGAVLIPHGFFIITDPESTLGARKLAPGIPAMADKPGWPDVRRYFQGRGIPFPAGSDAVYFQDGLEEVVALWQTPENIRRIREMVPVVSWERHCHVEVRAYLLPSDKPLADPTDVGTLLAMGAELQLLGKVSGPERSGISNGHTPIEAAGQSLGDFSKLGWVASAVQDISVQLDYAFSFTVEGQTVEGKIRAACVLESGRPVLLATFSVPLPAGRMRQMAFVIRAHHLAVAPAPPLPEPFSEVQPQAVTKESLLLQAYWMFPSFATARIEEGGKDISEWFQSTVGVEFILGARAVAFPSGWIIIRNTREQLDLAEPKIVPLLMNWGHMGAAVEVRTFLLPKDILLPDLSDAVALEALLAQAELLSQMHGVGSTLHEGEFSWRQLQAGQEKENGCLQMLPGISPDEISLSRLHFEHAFSLTKRGIKGHAAWDWLAGWPRIELIGILPPKLVMPVLEYPPRLFTPWGWSPWEPPPHERPWHDRTPLPLLEGQTRIIETFPVSPSQNAVVTVRPKILRKTDSK